MNLARSHGRLKRIVSSSSTCSHRLRNAGRDSASGEPGRVSCRVTRRRAAPSNGRADDALHPLIRSFVHPVIPMRSRTLLFLILFTALGAEALWAKPAPTPTAPAKRDAGLAAQADAPLSH